MNTIRNLLGYMTGAAFNIIFIVLAIGALYFVSTRAYAFGMEMFVADTQRELEDITVQIPESYDVPGRADPMATARILEEAGLINNAWVFYLEARLNGTRTLFRPGTYVFNTHMSPSDIMQLLQRAEFRFAEETSIRIPEGATLRQIGEIAEREGFFTADEFVEAANEYARGFFFLEPVRWRENFLEGYLFPDYYRLPVNPRPQDLLDRMLARFQDVFNHEMEERAEELGLTIDEVVIIASIIEREVRLANERAVVSAIIHNRLASNMHLEMCSTVRFALDLPPYQHILNIHTAVDSPFNTYRHAGLPLGPISNPGRAALVAALNPADVNYLFMVLRDVNSGEHHFSRTFAEHDAARIRYSPYW